MPGQRALDASDPETPTEHPGHLFHQLPFRDVAYSTDSLTVDLDNRPDLSNTRGALQGGLIATLVDVAAGRLAADHAPDGRGVATADLTIHYLAAIVAGPARAVATLVRVGRSQIVVGVDVFDVGADRIAARATVSFAILRPIS